MVTDVFAGQYHSVFKGQGIEFDEVREYQFGDDIRRIDWNVTARTGVTHVKQFIEERELTVMIMIDMSRSSFFSSTNKLKSQVAAELSALVALSAVRNNDKVGLIIFTDRVEKFIPARKGRKHILRLIREILSFDPENHQTDICSALDYFNSLKSRRATVFFVSDFLISKEDLVRLQHALKIINKRHDVIPVILSDPHEQELKDHGLVFLQDAENKEYRLIDTSNTSFQEKYIKDNSHRLEVCRRMFLRAGLDVVDVNTAEAYDKALVKFFRKRKHKR